MSCLGIVWRHCMAKLKSMINSLHLITIIQIDTAAHSATGIHRSSSNDSFHISVFVFTFSTDVCAHFLPASMNYAPLYGLILALGAFYAVLTRGSVGVRFAFYASRCESGLNQLSLGTILETRHGLTRDRNNHRSTLNQWKLLKDTRK